MAYVSLREHCSSGGQSVSGGGPRRVWSVNTLPLLVPDLVPEDEGGAGIGDRTRRRLAADTAAQQLGDEDEIKLASGLAVVACW